MTIKYRTADAFPNTVTDMGSQDKNHPSFSVYARQKTEGRGGPCAEGWYDIYSTATNLTELDIISLAKKHLGIDIEIGSY